MSKNILFTSQTPFHPQKGGVGRVTDTLSKEFIKQGYKIFYLNYKWHNKYEKNYNYPAKVYVLPSSNINDTINKEFYWGVLKKEKIDIIIHQDALFESSYFFFNIGPNNAKQLAVLHNNPLLIYDNLWAVISQLKNDSKIEKFKRIVRCILYPRIKRSSWERMLKHYDFLFHNADKVVLLSPRYFNSIERIKPQLLKKTISIYNPNTYPEQIDLPTKSKEIIFVGRLYEQSKKISRLLKIWRKIYYKHSDWKLKIVGDGKDKKYLMSLSDSLFLENIEFTGLQDPEQFYKDAAIICMTSDFEGFPMTLTEAMQFGCVPIAFDSFDAIHDIIIPGITGELVNPFDLKEYTFKLSKLLTDNNYRNKLSFNAFNHVKQFDSKIIANNWIKVFESKL